MSDYQLPVLEITVPYINAAEASEILKPYNAQVIAVDGGNDSVFNFIAVEPSVEMPDTARFIIENEDPEKIESELNAIPKLQELGLTTRIVTEEDDLLF